METEWSFRYATPKPEGPLVEMSAEEMERILLQRVSLEQSDPAEALWQLGRFYCQIKRQDRALDCLRQILARPVDAECCRHAVRFATSKAQKVRPPVHRGWRKHLILARMKLRWLIHRLFRSQ